MLATVSSSETRRAQHSPCAGCSGSGTLGAQAQLNAMKESQLVEKIKQQNPKFRALYAAKTPRQKALISRGLRAYQAARQDLRAGFIPN